MDYEEIASQLMRALRGQRSQEAFARRLGCRSNAIYTWESGRNFPTAARALSAAEACGVSVAAALQRFYAPAPSWLREVDPTGAQAVALLLNDLRGKTSIAALSRGTGLSRFAISRVLKGQAQPRLPDFLRLIEGTSLRLLDFLACLVDPNSLPCVKKAYQDLEATRRAAYESPWSQVILRALELKDYAALARHQPGWLARRLGMDQDQESECLELLSRSGQIRSDGDGPYRPHQVTTVDTRRDPLLARRLRAYWSRAAAERFAELDGDSASVSAYNLFGVSQADLEQLRELQRAYFRQMRAIIARSDPVEAVVLANMQLIELSEPRPIPPT